MGRMYYVVLVVFFVALFASMSVFEHDLPDFEDVHAITSWVVVVVQSMLFFPTHFALGRAGQSVQIGWLKLIGTFVCTIAETTLYQTNHPYIIVRGWGCLVLDLAYIRVLKTFPVPVPDPDHEATR